MQVGLVDDMGSLWTAGRQIHKDLKLKDEFSLKFIEKKKKMGFLDIMVSLEESVSNLNFNSLTEMANTKPRLMFK